MNHNQQDGSIPIKRVYTVDEISDILGIGRSAAYELVKQEYFCTVKIGTAIRISKKSFDEWLDGIVKEK